MKNIEAYSLIEFCYKTQEAIDEGYRFDFDTNANVPITYGTMYICKMVKSEEVKPKIERKDAALEGGSPRKKKEVTE